MLAAVVAAVGMELVQEVLRLLVEMVHLQAQMPFQVQLIVAAEAVVLEVILLAQAAVLAVKVS